MDTRSLWIEFDETIVGRWEYRDATWNRCVKGAIEAPIQCNCAVYYNARFTEHPGGYVIVDGVAGLDSGYCGGEGGQFRWILKNAEGMPEGMLVVGDWDNRECVPEDVFARYVDKVFYEREGQVVAAVVTLQHLPYVRTMFSAVMALKGACNQAVHNKSRCTALGQ